MENKELKFKGIHVNGFLMIAILVAAVAGAVMQFVAYPLIAIAIGIICVVCCRGFFIQQPNESRVMVFFGKYCGTSRKVGFYWINPFVSRKKISLRIHNMNIEPIKVNDNIGNPVLIGMVLVWKVKDTYKAVFDVDSQAPVVPGSAAKRTVHAQALEDFVSIQSDAALREVTGHFAYDNTDSDANQITLRDGGGEISELLERKINERLAMAGIEAVEARINYLAYAPEIAAVMLRRQQASAIIAAREKIVEGAVSMVKMALDQLSSENVVELDEERKAAMVSNLLVVLCADDPAQPVLNTGSLYQ